jgi:hypothetical protein
METKNYNFTDVIIGFACPYDMEKQIIEESKRLCDTKSGVIRRALLFYFENIQKIIGGEKCYGNQK